jgi:hypothetical protein
MYKYEVREAVDCGMRFTIDGEDKSRIYEAISDIIGEAFIWQISPGKSMFHSTENCRSYVVKNLSEPEEASEGRSSEDGDRHVFEAECRSADVGTLRFTNRSKEAVCRSVGRAIWCSSTGAEFNDMVPGEEKVLANIHGGLWIVTYVSAPKVTHVYTATRSKGDVDLTLIVRGMDRSGLADSLRRDLGLARSTTMCLMDLSPDGTYKAGNKPKDWIITYTIEAG